MQFHIIKKTFNSRGEMLTRIKVGEVEHREQANELVNSLNNARTFEEKRRKQFSVVEESAQEVGEIFQNRPIPTIK